MKRSQRFYKKGAPVDNCVGAGAVDPVDNFFGGCSLPDVLCRCGLVYPAWSIGKVAGSRCSECGADLRALRIPLPKTGPAAAGPGRDSAAAQRQGDGCLGRPASEAGSAQPQADVTAGETAPSPSASLEPRGQP